MIDKLETRAYLRAMERRGKSILTMVLLGSLLLWGLAGQLQAGVVQEANSGREGQTLEPSNLPVMGKTTLVDFFSPYCPPCMRLAPLLEQLAQKRPDLVVKKVNIQRPEVSGHIDWQSPLAKQLGLRSIPHFMIFNKQGKVVVEGREAMQQVLGWLQGAGLLKE